MRVTEEHANHVPAVDNNGEGQQCAVRLERALGLDGVVYVNAGQSKLQQRQEVRRTL